MFQLTRNFISTFRHPPEPNWHVERQAKPSETHPLGGFWKRNIKRDQGLAIGPAEDNKYFISFCGPSCFAKGTYRPDSAIEGDPDYRVIDKNAIAVKGKAGFSKYVRVKSRQPA